MPNGSGENGQQQRRVRIRPQDRTSVLDAFGGGVTPRRGIQFVQVGRLDETAAMLKDIESIENGGSSFRIIQASYGSGKLLPLDADILTPDGWKHNGDLCVGDKVITRYGTETEITNISPESDIDTYSLVLDDGRQIECGLDHQWIVYDTVAGNEVTMTTRAIKEAGLQTDDGGYRFEIPNVNELPMDETKPAILPWEYGNIIAVERTQDGSACMIPDDYLYGSVKQRKELVRGIISTVGADRPVDSIPSDGEIPAQSLAIANQIANVLRSLGRYSSVEYHTDKYVVAYAGHDRRAAITDIVNEHEKQDMQCISVADPSCSYITDDYTVTHNTFFLTLTKTIALKRNFIVMNCDFSPDRRLYSTSKKALGTYRALIKSMSTMTHPDGGAIEELLSAIDERITLNDTEFLSNIRRLECGFDAVTVLDAWHRACHPTTKKEEQTSFHIKDICLRWFSGEMTLEQKRELGLNETINDATSYDALKLIAFLGHEAGYAGTLVEYDECVNLYKINNSLSRDKNYEQILRIFNEAKQGDARYIGFIFAGTPESVSDIHRGLFSYEALRSRLLPSKFHDPTKTVDTTGPLIDLAALSQEDLLVLLGNLTNVEALGKKEDWLVDDDQMRRFLKLYFDALGADYYRTPREITRSFVSLLRMLRENPDMTFDDALGQVEVKDDSRRASGLTNVVRRRVDATTASDDDEDDEDDFGF